MTVVHYLAETVDDEADDRPKTEIEQAVDLLNFLNMKTGKNYRAVDANTKMIRARLREYGYEDLRSMIALKVREWRSDDYMAKYLRPATLFNATKCAQYTGELE